MIRTKATVRRLLPTAPQERIAKKNILNGKEISIPFKIQKLIPQSVG